MADKIAEIRKLKDYYVNDLYQEVRNQQNRDQKYIDDTFEVPEVREPHEPMRLGTGYDIVNSPAEQIVTQNPQAFIKVLRGKSRDEAQIRISKVVNNLWIPILKRMNPNPFKESVKNLLSRGENYIKVVHNPSWVTGDRTRVGLPVLMLVPEPMVVYGSPEEDENGIPERVIIYYQRHYRDVIQRYPEWSNPNKRGLDPNQGKMIDFLEYWDKENRYYEADDEPLLKSGIQPNLYGFVPLVRKYSGFGKNPHDGDLSKLIVSDIRHNRDLIRHECALTSDIASVLHLFAHKGWTLQVPQGTEISQDELDNLDMGAYSMKVLHIPPDSKFGPDDVTLPEPQIFAFLEAVRNRIVQRNPFILAGFPYGSSGRQQDMAGMAAMRRYETVIENIEHAWATAFEMALRICYKIPGLRPEGLQLEDLKSVYQCAIKLREDDPQEEDRLATLGDRLWAQGNGCIDLRTNLTKYQGYTEDEAELIVANLLVDKLTLQNPEVAEVMGMVFAEESGMEKWLEEAKNRRAGMGDMMPTASLGQPSSPTAQRRRQGEIMSPMGREQMDMSLISKGARNPPSRYTRGG